MKTFVTADIHFSHANIIKFCPASRKFKDADEMDQKIVQYWNEDIQPEDLTYIIGDVAFCNADKARTLLNRLNGRKVLIAGNHDRKNLTYRAFRECFVDVYEYLDVRFEDNDIAMFHYPIYEWNKMHRGALHFHGHVHAQPTGISGRIFDVCMDGNDCRPHDMHDLVKKVLKEPIRSHH